MRCVAWLVPFHVQQDGRSSGEKKLGYAGLCKRLTAWRTDAPVHPCNSHSMIGDMPTPTSSPNGPISHVSRRYAIATAVMSWAR